MARKGYTKRADGRLVKAITDPRTRKKIYFYGATEKEINRKILEYRGQRERGRAFSEIANEWYDESAPNVAIQTLKSYKAGLKDAVAEFGMRYMRDIAPKDINSYLRKLANKGLSAKTVTQKRLVLNLIFKHGIIAGDIDTNPCLSAVMPKDMPKNTRTAASLEDEKKVRESADVWLFPYFALLTGMRKGEILALQWKDIDFEENIIHVTKSVCHQGDRPIVKAPKTEAGKRDVPLLIPLKEKLLKIEPRPADRYLISDTGEKPLTNRRFITLSRKFREATGVSCTAHELRHSFATVAFENDVPAKAVQEILGHKQLSTTMDIYTDLRKKSLYAAADILNKAAK